MFIYICICTEFVEPFVMYSINSIPFTFLAIVWFNFQNKFCVFACFGGGYPWGWYTHVLYYNFWSPLVCLVHLELFFFVYTLRTYSAAILLMFKLLCDIFTIAISCISTAIIFIALRWSGKTYRSSFWLYPLVLAWISHVNCTLTLMDYLVYRSFNGFG